MPGKISPPAAILRIRFARISSLTERGRYPDALSSPTVVGLDMPAPVWAKRPARTPSGDPDDALIVVCQLEGCCEDGRLPDDLSICTEPALVHREMPSQTCIACLAGPPPRAGFLIARRPPGWSIPPMRLI